MQIHITVDQVAEWAAHQYINMVEPGIDARRRNQILPIEKFNMVARGFSLSTVCLVIGAVSLFFSVGAALIYFGTGMILRKTTGDELTLFKSVPGDLHEVRNVVGWFRNVVADLRQLPYPEQDRNVFDRLGIRAPRDWDERKTTINLCGAELWQSTIPWPEAGR